MKIISELLLDKGNEIWSVHPDDTVHDALALMAERNAGALLVMEGKRLVGIVSERDYARKVVLERRRSHSTPVRDIMTKDVITIEATQKLEEAMALLISCRIRHLPVFAKGKLCGVISIGDVLKSLLGEQKQVIQHMEDYISGETP
jgi:CBS domain-containing protein